jgi:uncharacterized protein (TIGR00255 family)
LLHSMTGFGRGSYRDEDFSVVVEIKSVNHRYSEFAIRMPHYLNALEDKIKKSILQRCSRGRFDIFITALNSRHETEEILVDKDLAHAYHKALQQIGAAIGSPEVSFNPASEVLYLSRCQDVLNVAEGVVDADVLWPKVEKALTQALDILVAMREAEAGNIIQDFLLRADIIESLLQKVELRSPVTVQEYEVKLRERVERLLAEKDAHLDPQIILQEVAVFADRTSITEECVRLHSHLKQLREFLNGSGPVGRKLDFLVQEINREVNTIGSKCNDFELSKQVVDIKAEVEKIREQVQNIE